MRFAGICNYNKCTGCGLCSAICPNKCISFEENSEGFLYPVINKSICINCLKCERSCPQNNRLPGNIPDFYMAIHNDIDILKKSSSGGAFTALANYVFGRSGVVFGAYMTEEKTVKHIKITNPAELDKLRLSKYYQSDTREALQEAFHSLEDGKAVLFSGTACQIAALLSFVPDKLKNNLITVDVLCHGVTSKKVVDSYIKSQERIVKKKVIDYKFRIKNSDIGWNNGYGRTILGFEDGSNHIERKRTDSFFYAYNSNTFLRESCYTCNFSGKERISDFTIADFWGISQERATSSELHNGVSLLLCNTYKARSILPILKKNMKIVMVTADEAIPYNKALTEPNSKPKEHDAFFKMINEGKDYNYIIKKIYRKQLFIQLTKNIIKRVIGKRATALIKSLLLKNLR